MKKFLSTTAFSTLSAGLLCVVSLSGCQTSSSKKAEKKDSEAVSEMKEGAAKIGEGIGEVARGAGQGMKEGVCPVVGVRSTKLYYTQTEKRYVEVMKGEKTFSKNDDRECFLSAEVASESGFKHGSNSVARPTDTRTKAGSSKPNAKARVFTANKPTLNNAIAPTETQTNTDASTDFKRISTTPSDAPVAINQGNEAVNAEGDNSEVNENKNGVVGSSAEQQSNQETDVEITRKIRRAVTLEKSLSTYAHNVKIITQQVKVVLKGPVRSAQEKAIVESKAAIVAGKEQVKSELEVVPR